MGNVSIANASAITALDAIVDDCDNGTTNAQATLTIYSGTAPTNVDAALSGNTVLAELDMSNPAFGSATDDSGNNRAQAVAAAISDDTNANATGTATFYRILDRDNTAVIQGDVGTSGEELNLTSTSITSGITVSVTSLTIYLNEGP